MKNTKLYLFIISHLSKTSMFFLLFLIIASSININAQILKDLKFEEISINEGLSQSIVDCIIQDKSGFLWFGTEDGLNRYDGYNFTIFKHDPTDSTSLSYNEIKTLLEDSEGNFWIGTFGGLNKYDPKSGTFIRYLHDPANPNSLINNNINYLYEDSKKNLWICTDEGLDKIDITKINSQELNFIHITNSQINDLSLSSYKINTILEDKSGLLWIGTFRGINLIDFNAASNTFESDEYYLYSKTTSNISDNEVLSLHEDVSGNIWIGTNGDGLIKFDPAQNKFKTYQNKPSNRYSLSNNHIFSIFEDKKGILWIGTDGGGINLFDKDTEKFSYYINDISNPSSLTFNEIRTLYEDNSGILWIGTYGGGVNKTNRAVRQFEHFFDDPQNPNDLNENIVWSMFEDSSEIIWLGTHGGGLNRFDKKNNKYKYYRHNRYNSKSISNNVVRNVFKDSRGFYWIGTHGGGLNKFNPETGRFIRYLNNPDDSTSISHNELRAIYEDKDSNLWIGTNGGGLNKVVLDKKGLIKKFIRYQNIPNDSNSLSNNFVRAIYEDSFGNFWIGTQGGGLNKFNKKTGVFTHYQNIPDDSTSLSNDFIFSLHQNKSGNLWIATWGGGLNKFNYESETFTSYTVKDGLPNNAVYGIMEDKLGNLWLSSNDGLSKFDTKLLTFKNYTVSDGLQSKEFNGGSYFKNSNGKMYFGGINGFNIFHPDSIKDNRHIPPVVFTSFRKFNKEVKFQKPINEINKIELSYKDHLFSFEFAALDYTNPLKNLYAYKMEGLHDNWIYTDAKHRTATFTNLSPGHYTLKVKGSNNDGIWNENEKSINIIILPPFWATWWFRLLAILFIAAIVIKLYKSRLRNVRVVAELQTAHNAQMSIMPQKDPEIESLEVSGICLPANEVGGDFFDYIWLDEEKTKFGIVVADVSGKAMQAAITAVMTSGMIYSRIKEVDSIKNLMSKLNTPIFSKTDRRSFVALCFSSIDINTKEFKFTNAGLIRPMLKRKNKIRHLRSKGHTQPLGLIKTNYYEEKKIQLLKDDILIIITDGILDTCNKEGQFFGEDRFNNFLENMNTNELTASQIRYQIMDHITNFSKNTKYQCDDITLVVVKVK